MTQAILNSINMKDVLYKKFIQANNEDENIYSALKEEYTRYRKTLRHSIREAKKMYYTRTFNIYKNNMKTTWKIINDTLRKKSSTSCDAHFISNGQIIKNHDEIADQFNHFFISIGSKLSREIQPMNDHKQYLRNPTESQLIFTSVEEQHVLTIINNLKDKSSYGHDGISNNLITWIKDVLIKPLTLLINQMLSSGHFPSQLKISRVIPLFKSGDPELFSNYRPISLLPSLSKIFERVIFNQLINYMNNNKLLSLEQYGFRPGHSTELAALQLVNKITEQMDIGKIPLSIHMDLSKAFDTLDHSILLSKLAYYGIGRDMCNNLLKSYLTDRYQYVEYKSARSPTKSIITGVPQGSILGPLLFLIYINDLPMVSQIFDMIMYADDTTLYCNINRDISDQDINAELKKVSDWLCSNKLSLNVKKTKCMVFHTAQRKVAYPILTLNNIEIERVTQFNFLGVIISSNMKWNGHVTHISQKISRIVGIMYKLKHIYPQAVLLTLYSALIVPHLTYCLLAWGSKIVPNHPLHLLQKKALRILASQDYISHTEPICKEYRILKIFDMYKLAIWKFYFKLMNNELPHYFTNMKPELPRVAEYYSLRRPTFHLPRISHEFAEHMLEYQMIKALNNPEASAFIAKVHTHSYFGFKLYVKNTIINQYLDHCTLQYCNTCDLLANRRLQPPL